MKTYPIPPSDYPDVAIDEYFGKVHPEHQKVMSDPRYRLVRDVVFTDLARVAVRAYLQEDLTPEAVSLLVSDIKSGRF